MQAATAGRTLVSEMKETSTVARSGANGRSAGSRLRALRRSITVTRGSSRRPQIDLPVGDIEGDHPRRAALQQAIGEAAGRGADVEAVTAVDVDPERAQRVVELDPAAGDESRARIDHELGVGLDQLARAQRDRAVAADTHGAGANGAGGRRARRKQAPISEHSVDSRLLHRCNGTGNRQMQGFRRF